MTERSFKAGANEEFESDLGEADIPIGPGSKPTSVGHLQRLLTQCGYVAVDDLGTFGSSTKNQLRAFQQSKGITPNGICDGLTWHVLIEAHWKLGDRLLYLKTPMLRGDDIAQLQGRLSWLGFDPGKVDGVFGPKTLRAVGEFQINVGLSGDGISGAETIAELERNIGRSSVTVTSFKEALRFGDPAKDIRTLKLAIAAPLNLAVNAEMIRQSLNKEGIRSTSFIHPDITTIASLTNTSGADLSIFLEISRSNQGCISYFQGFRYTSTIGRSIAQTIADELEKVLPIPSVEVLGSTHRMLQLTRTPSVVVAIGEPHLWSLYSIEISAAIISGLTSWKADQQ